MDTDRSREKLAPLSFFSMEKSEVSTNRNASWLPQDYLGAATLFVINLIVVWKLLFIEYVSFLHSNEQSFVSIAVFIRTHWPFIQWFPLWDLGMPFENAYFPLVPFLVAALSSACGISESRAYHILMALSYCIGPVGLFGLCKAMSGSLRSSFVAALLWSLTSLSAVLFSPILKSLGGISFARRLSTIVYYGEGPHNFALTLLPWVLWLLWDVLNHDRSARHRALLVAFAAIAASANPFGTVSLLLSCICLYLLVPGKPLHIKIVYSALSASVCYLLLAGVISPLVIRTIYQQSQHVAGDFKWKAGKIFILITVGLLVFLVSRLTKSLGPDLRLAMLGLISIGSFPALYFWFGIGTVPQPERYHLEVEFFGTILLSGILYVVPKKGWRSYGVVATFVILSISQLLVFREYSDKLIQPIAIEGTPQFAIANWASGNLKAHDRMFVGGDAGFLFNVFSLILQIGNGHEPSTPNYIQEVGVFTIYSGMNAGGDKQDAHYSLLWLTAFGAKAVMVPGPLQGESLQPFARPNKFDGVLPLIGRPGGWRVYDVGLAQDSLFRVVPERVVVRNAPMHGLDVVEIEPFAQALQSSPYSVMARTTPEGNWNLTGRVPPGHVVSFAVNYDIGWRAFKGNKELDVKKDGLGLMIISPECDQPCQIRIEFSGGLIRKVCRLVSIVAWLLILWVIVTNRYPFYGGHNN